MTTENQHTDPEEATGGYGTPTPEQEAGGVDQQGRQDRGDDDTVRPSAEAEIDENNDDSQGSAADSSEPGQEAAGIPDGSGNDLPEEESPKDDDGDEFAAG